VQIKVAFFKGQGKWYDQIVRRYTSSKYSHAELILPDDKTALSITPFGRHGVRQEKFDFKEEWDFVEINIDEEQHERLLYFYKSTKGDGYDWLGMIASRITPFHVKRVGRWYCSEWIAYALRLICVLDNVYAYADLTPQRLYELLNIYRLEQQLQPAKEKESPIITQDPPAVIEPAFKSVSPGVYIKETEL